MTRQLMELMQYSLLFRWFVGLGIDDPVWGEGRPEICPVDRFQPQTGQAPGRGPAVLTKNRGGLLTTAMSREVMAEILAHREVAPLLSDEHFSVNGTLVKARVSVKSFSRSLTSPRLMPRERARRAPSATRRSHHLSTG